MNQPANTQEWQDTLAERGMELGEPVSVRRVIEVSSQQIWAAVTQPGYLTQCHPFCQENAVDLRRVVRANPGDVQAVQAAIRKGIANKPHGHEFRLGGEQIILRRMNMTGG